MSALINKANKNLKHSPKVLMKVRLGPFNFCLNDLIPALLSSCMIFMLGHISRPSCGCFTVHQMEKCLLVYTFLFASSWPISINFLSLSGFNYMGMWGLYYYWDRLLWKGNRFNKLGILNVKCSNIMWPAEQAVKIKQVIGGAFLNFVSVCP